ncbi:hypothetical protein K449DRAFT_384917 [Hypoxylon sp. EC38]|nr:hypothetical protein K449DRAFT_384917 [Hypoxylon sp. EC38]
MQHVRKTFLDIPADIRERIFLDAGLIEGVNILLTEKTPGYVSENLCRDLSVTYNLLQTCKTIYAQVKSFLFARNTIIVWHENVEAGLEILRSLSQEQCRSLRDVFVHLHVENDIYTGEQKLPKTTLSPERIAVWQATARHILSRVEPGTLSLHIISDTGDSEETRSVCQPLLDFPGKLKECELRLGWKRQPHVSALAFEIGTRIQGGDPESWNKPFRFLDLPFEIRRHILQYTDLVTPFNRVTWDSKTGFKAVFNNCWYLCGSCEPGLHYACLMRWCKRDDTYETGCFCPNRQSAYASICHCWCSPKALMSVSRAVYQDAIDLFYSSNRVMIIPSEGLDYRFCSPNSLSRLDASRFITRHMWPGVLRHLRTLEFIFPYLGPESCPETCSPLYLDWCFAIDHLKAYANLAQLTVIVHTWLRGSSDVRPSLIQSGWTGESTLKAQARLLTPLQALRKMKRFFVFLEWSWHWTPDHLGSTTISERDAKHRIVIEMERWLEHTVMGNEYDSLSVGKMKERESWWWRNT